MPFQIGFGWNSQSGALLVVAEVTLPSEELISAVDIREAAGRVDAGNFASVAEAELQTDRCLEIRERCQRRVVAGLRALPGYGRAHRELSSGPPSARTRPGELGGEFCSHRLQRRSRPACASKATKHPGQSRRSRCRGPEAGTARQFRKHRRAPSSHPRLAASRYGQGAGCRAGPDPVRRTLSREKRHRSMTGFKRAVSEKLRA